MKRYRAALCLIAAAAAAAMLLVSCTDKEPVPAERDGMIYYNSLDGGSKELYFSAENEMAELSDRSVHISRSASDSSFERAIACLMLDNPRLFYLDTTRTYITYTGDGALLYLGYTHSASEITHMLSELDAAAREMTAHILENASDSKDEFSLLVAAQDALTLSVTRSPADEASASDRQTEAVTEAESESSGGRYTPPVLEVYNPEENELSSLPISDTEPLYSTAYGALVLGKADAVGYAQAMTLLLRSLGLEANTAYGEYQGQRHTWNSVRIGDYHYYADAYSDDPEYDETAAAIPFHGHLCAGEEIVSRYLLYENSPVPRPYSGMDYYTKKGVIATDADTTLNIVTTALASGVETFDLRFFANASGVESIAKTAISRFNALRGEEVYDGTVVSVYKAGTDRTFSVRLYKRGTAPTGADK